MFFAGPISIKDGVVVTRPLARNAGMVEHHGPPEAVKLFRAWTKFVEKQRVTKEQAAKRLRSWIVQNEIRGVFGWMTTGIA